MTGSTEKPAIAPATTVSAASATGAPAAPASPAIASATTVSAAASSLVIPPTVTLPMDIHNLLWEILTFFHKQEKELGEIYIVGGTIRDLLLGKTEVLDLDLAVSRSPIASAQRIAHSKNAGFVVLDQEREVARIVKPLSGKVITVDFARYRAPTIEEDLHDRDFTINALAIKLSWPLLEKQLQILDPLGGYDDLKKGLIRPCAEHLFRDDPLRILRAYRFGATLGFSLVPELDDLIKRDAPLLKAVSRERIRDEFFKVLSCPNSHHWIRLMSDSGVLREFLPKLDATKGVVQNDWHHLDVFDHTLLTLELFEDLLIRQEGGDFWGKVNSFLAEPISGTRSYLELFKFGCLLHDIGKPACKKVVEGTGKVIFHGHEMEGVKLVKAIGESLKLSVAEILFLQKTVKNHMRPGVILQELEQKGKDMTDNDRNRLLFRFFTETGRDGVGIALISLADRLSARGQHQDNDLGRFTAEIYNFITSFYQQTENTKLPPLLCGTDLITHFRLSPGPAFKEILDSLKEAQALGIVQDHSQAIEYVSRLLSEKKP